MAQHSPKQQLSLARQCLGDGQTTGSALLLMLYLNNKEQELCIMLDRIATLMACSVLCVV